MKKLKINFVDFWPGFNKIDNYFYNILSKKYIIEICDNPDYLFFSVFGGNNYAYSCKKIFYTGENIAPDFANCDYSLSFDYLDDCNHYRLPLYVIYDGYYDLVNKKISGDLFNRKFCNFIYSNTGAKTRNNFFHKLSKYKKIDSGGKCLNNLEYLVDDKIKFQSEYKFSIAFENEAHRITRDGYTTEKILHPMLANSIPIYWGNPLIHHDFNTKSFINFYDFRSEDEMIDYIFFLDNNEAEYKNILTEFWLENNSIKESLKEESVLKFFSQIFNTQ
jgi:hypothetical protein